VFTFTLVENDDELYGPVVLSKRDWQPDESIPPGTMRVVTVLEPERDGQ
jgi:hypothetical protein